MSVERPCDVCGELYIATRPNSKTCGPACRQRAKRRGTPEGVDDTPATPRPNDVTSAAASGDHLATLKALRDTLARQIDSAKDPFGLPALANQMVRVLAEIAKLEPPVRKGTALDELARRRKTARASSPKRSAQRR